MKKNEKTPKPLSGSVKVEPDVLLEAKEICKKNGTLITHYVTEALKEKNKKVKDAV